MASVSRSRLKKSATASVVLFYNKDKVEAVRALKSVRQLLKDKGVGVTMAEDGRLEAKIKTCDFAIALGGDGTMLQTARVLAPYSVPLLGVNAGGLGFLSALDVPEFKKRLREIISGKFVVQQRFMLSVEVRRGTRVVFGPNTALNDCVVRCADQARAVTLGVESARKFVADYFGDGLVVATPTGSTAYALAVGGPVVIPGVDAFVLAPISPHALTSRPLLMPAAQPIVVRLKRRNPHDRPSALVSLDGQMTTPIHVGDDIHIRRNPQPFKLLVPPDRTHFELLQAKLKWSER